MFSEAELVKWDLVMYGTDVPVGATGDESFTSSVVERSVGTLRDPTTGAGSSARNTFALTILSLLSVIIHRLLNAFHR